MSPDLFISGRDLAVPAGATVGRQITKDGQRSFELSSLVLGTEIRDFALSMICMPVNPPEVILDGGVFQLELIDANRYKVTIDGISTVIPFDSTCHYLYVSRGGNALTVIIGEKRYSFDISSEEILELISFVGTGTCLVDKLMFSKSSALMKKDYYDQLTPAVNLASLDEESYIDWVFSYDKVNPRIFTYKDAELIDDKYIVPLTMLEGEANTVRNLSRYPIDISYDAGANWTVIQDVEKVSNLVPSVVVRSSNRDFEFVVDSYESDTVQLPGVQVNFQGSVYPYHRDERTYYTNAEYDFSKATVHITPIEGHLIRSIWIYGRLSQDILNELQPENIYRDGKLVSIADVTEHENRLYLLVVNSNVEVVLNPTKSKYLAINALGVSNITTETHRIEAAFNVFAGNTVISFAEEVENMYPGVIVGADASYRIIDVQWTI